MTNKLKKVLITVVALAALALGGSALAGAGLFVYQRPVSYTHLTLPTN